MLQADSEITEENPDDHRKSQDVIVSSGNFYMDLDGYLAITSNENNLSTFRVLYKDKIAGVLQDPRVKPDADHITLEEFRENFHTILEESLREDKGFFITVEDRPVCYFSSRGLYLKELVEARDFLIKWLKKEEKTKRKTSSFFSGFLKHKTK